MNTVLPIMLIIVHLVCYALIWIGIELKILKLKRYMLPFVLFVPVIGVICCLILHFQVPLGGEQKATYELHKMKNDQDIYRSITTENKTAQKTVIPLEEALLVNDSKTKRNLIMDVLNDHPERYLDVLLQARMNEDAEVVHYATTSMVELSKSYDYQMQQLELKRAESPENDEILEEYCAFLKTYLAQGIAKGKLEEECRERYSRLLKQRLAHTKTLSVFAELAENELERKHYDTVWELLKDTKESWQMEEPYQMLLLRYYVETRQRDKIKQQIAYIDSQNIYMTQENRKKLDYWRTSKHEKECKSGGGEAVPL